MRPCIALVLALLAASAAACQAGTYTPQPVQADAFFHGRAYVDTNGNGKVDSEDTPLEGARFSAEDSRGVGNSDWTGSDGRGMAWFVGGGVHYPVTLRIQPPEGSGLVVVGAEELVLQDGDKPSVEFLFAPGPSPSASVTP